MDVRDLLRLHAGVSRELRAREVVRSANSPMGDLAEYMFCKAFGWSQEANSQKGFDAVCSQRLRYQIKGLRLHKGRKSRQLSVVRRLVSKPFDILAAVMVDEEYTVLRGVLIPHAVVLRRAHASRHVNGHILHLKDNLWDEPEARDVTRELQQVVL